jgi:hypothetical protein
MNFFKEKTRIWLELLPEGKKPNLKAHTERLGLLIDLNRSEISTYTSYLIALFSISTPLFIALWSAEANIYIFVGFLILLVFLVYKIINQIGLVKDTNEKLVEGYNVIQSKRAGSYMVLFEGTQRDILKKFEEMQNKFGGKLSQYNPFNENNVKT